MPAPCEGNIVLVLRSDLRLVVADAHALRQPVFGRMQVFAALVFGLVLLDFQWMRLSIGVLALPGDLPADLHAGLATRDGESALIQLCGNVDRGEPADTGQLVGEVFVQSLEPVGDGDKGLAAGIQHDAAAIEIDHLIALHTGMDQIPVGRVQRVVYFEVFDPGKDLACHFDIAVKVAGIIAVAVGRLAVDSGRRETDHAEACLAGAHDAVAELGVAPDPAAKTERGGESAAVAVEAIHAVPVEALADNAYAVVRQGRKARSVDTVALVARSVHADTAAIAYELAARA